MHARGGNDREMSSVQWCPYGFHCIVLMTDDKWSIGL